MIKTHELRQSGAELAAVFAPLVRDGFLAVCEGGVELSKVRRRLLAVRAVLETLRFSIFPTCTGQGSPTEGVYSRDTGRGNSREGGGVRGRGSGLR